MSVKDALNNYFFECIEIGYVALTSIVTAQEVVRNGDFKPEYWQEGFTSTVLAAATAYFIGGCCFAFGLLVRPPDPQISRMDRAVTLGKMGMGFGCTYAAAYLLSATPPSFFQEPLPKEKQRQELYNHVASPAFVFTDTKREAEENLQHILVTQPAAIAFQPKLIAG